MENHNGGHMLLAVNGTLMRGLDLNWRMVEAGARFVAETSTAPCYRLWSIDDTYPGMLRDPKEGQRIDLEIWDVPEREIASIVAAEPDGLCLGKIYLEEGQKVLGILAEPYITVGKPEITHFGGWRKYIHRRANQTS